MLDKDVALGHPEKSQTQIRMALPPSVDVQKLLADTESCGDAQGWPAAQFVAPVPSRRIVLYPPKRCLLDKKVAAS
jgi:hypothetical protein